MDRTSQLISDYLDGELDDGGVEQLADALRLDAAAVEQLVLNSFVHSQLHHWMNVRQMRDEILADAVRGMDSPGCSLDSCDESVRLELAARDATSTRTARGRHLRHSWLGLMAGMATMLLIGVSIYASYRIASRPAVVAQLTQANACQWDESGQNLPVGSLLHTGQWLKLRSGRALVTFACGAQMVIEGPTSLQLASESRADLSQGRVGARVPTQAIGFTVATPLAHFVDLGTEFSLTLEASDACELQVFDGLVELRLFERDGHTVEQRLRISEGSAVRFDAARHDVASIRYDKEQRMMP